jgi:hypothetical protein
LASRRGFFLRIRHGEAEEDLVKGALRMNVAMGDPAFSGTNVNCLEQAGNAAAFPLALRVG